MHSGRFLQYMRSSGYIGIMVRKKYAGRIGGYSKILVRGVMNTLAVRLNSIFFLRLHGQWENSTTTR